MTLAVSPSALAFYPNLNAHTALLSLPTYRPLLWSYPIVLYLFGVRIHDDTPKKPSSKAGQSGRQQQSVLQYFEQHTAHTPVPPSSSKPYMPPDASSSAEKLVHPVAVDVQRPLSKRSVPFSTSTTEDNTPKASKLSASTSTRSKKDKNTPPAPTATTKTAKHDEFPLPSVNYQVQTPLHLSEEAHESKLTSLDRVFLHITNGRNTISEQEEAVLFTAAHQKAYREEVLRKLNEVLPTLPSSTSHLPQPTVRQGLMKLRTKRFVLAVLHRHQNKEYNPPEIGPDFRVWFTFSARADNANQFAEICSAIMLPCALEEFGIDD